jgi:protein-disulfide isomerase
MSKRRENEARRREQERRQTTLLLTVIGVIAVVLIGGAVIVSVSQGQQQASQPVAVSSNAPPTNAEANGRAWGQADAPIKVMEFIDYQCPSCGVQATQYEQGIIDAFADTGKVRYEIHSLSFIGPESRDAAFAALCAAEQSKFWEMHGTIFANQQGENQGTLAAGRLRQMAEKLGLDMTAYDQCVSSGKHDETLKADDGLASEYGVNSTPSFVVNGKVYSGIRTAEDLRRIFAEVAPEVSLNQ